MSLPTHEFARLDAINRYTTVARLLASVVHETGNALQVIGGHAELLQGMTPDPEKVDARAKAIGSHTAKASARLREVSGLLNDSTGQTPLVIDLHALCSEALGLRSFAVGRGRIAGIVQPESGRFQVKGIRPQILRIILNLLMNAEAALKPAGGKVQLSLEASGASVRLTITDSGPGIPADRRASVFEPFTSPDGPGLGLYVSRGLAEQNGGRLELLDAPPPGATLVLTLQTHTETTK